LSAKLRAFGAATLAVALADQALKAWIVSHLEGFGRLPLLGDFLVAMRLSSSPNTWGPFSDLPMAALGALLVVALGLLAGLLVRADRNDALTGWALGMISGAALASAVDRFYAGEVLDVLAIDLGRFALPPFNLADLAIVLGTLLLLIDIASSDASHAAASPARSADPAHAPEPGER
jgi:signal peptidase II